MNLVKLKFMVQFLVLATNVEERKIWEESFIAARDEQQTKDKRMAFQFQTIIDIEKLKSLMKRTAVMLLPLKPDSTMFGIEALRAAYSGVPILVSSNSGIASLMNSMEKVKQLCTTQLVVCKMIQKFGLRKFIRKSVTSRMLR